MKMGANHAKYGVMSSSSASEESDPEVIKTVRMPSSSADETLPAWVSSGESKTEWLEMIFNEPQSMTGLVYIGSTAAPSSFRMIGVWSICNRVNGGQKIHYRCIRSDCGQVQYRSPGRGADL